MTDRRVGPVVQSFGTLRYYDIIVYYDNKDLTMVSYVLSYL
jgi:hypothetical protein